MSEVIDSSIVELSLDNSNFERNVKKSIGLLDEFKGSVSDVSRFTVEAGKQMAEGLGVMAKAGFNQKITENLESFETAAKNVNSQFTIWGQAVQDVRKKLATIVSHELTLIPRKLSQTVSLVGNLVKSGGLSRALKLEQAQFQMQGLGVSWQKALEDINYGVQDTAYGLDSAARAASQLSASGVKLGDDMKAALRGISGVAAMTSSSYDDIAYVFTSVAGMGRATAQQLNRLSIRGINAFATLADYLGKTQAEVRDMVSKGQVDFDTFAKAMDSAFGEHAKDANKTFEGALSNVKAALSRIGAEIATPYYNIARDVLNNLRLFINSLKTALEGSLKDLGRTITILGGQIADFFDSIKEVDEHAFDGFENLIKMLNTYLKSDAFKAVRATIVQIFTDVYTVISWIVKWVGEVVFLAKPAFDKASGFAVQFVTTVSKAIDSVLSSLVRLTMALTPIIEPIVWGISDAFGKVARTVTSVRNELLAMGMGIRGLADPIAAVIKPLAGPLYDTLITIGKVISNIVKNLADVFEALLPIVTPVLKVLSGYFKMWLLGIERFWKYVDFIVTAVSKNIAPVVTSIGRSISRVGDLVWKIATGIDSLFGALWESVFGPLEGTVDGISGAIVSLFDKITAGIFKVEPLIKKVAQNIAYTLGFTVGTIQNIFDAVAPAGKFLDKFFDFFIGALKTSFTLVSLIVEGLNFIFTGKFIGTLKDKTIVTTFINVVKTAFGEMSAWLAVKVAEISTLFTKKTDDTAKDVTKTADGAGKGLVGVFTGIFNSIKNLDFAGLGTSVIQGLLSPFTGHTVGASTLYDDLDEETKKMIASSGANLEELGAEMTTQSQNTINKVGETMSQDVSNAIAQTGETVQQQTQSTTTDIVAQIIDFARQKIIPAVSTIIGELDSETINKITGTLVRLTPIIKSFLLTWGLTHLFKPLKSVFKPLDGIFKPFGEILKPLEGIAKSLEKAHLDIEIKNGFEKTFDELIKVGKNINKNFKANAFSTYAKSFLLIASSIGVLTASFVALTKYVDPNKIKAIIPVFASITAAVAVLGKVISGFNFTKTTYQMSALDKIVPHINGVLGSLKNTIQQVKLNSFIVAFSASVGVLAVSVAKFAGISWDDAIKAMGMYGTFLTELIIAHGFLRLFKMDSFSKFSVSLSASVGILGLAIRTFTNVDWEAAFNAMVLYGAFLGELAGFNIFLRIFNVKDLQSFSISFSASIPLLSLGVRSFAGIKFDDAKPMLGVAFAFFSELAIISKAINSRKATFMNTIFTLLTMGEMFAIMEGIALTISMMTLLDEDKLMKVATPLAMVGAVFAGMELGSLALAKTKLSGIILMISVLGEVMYGLYYLTTNLDDNQLEKYDRISTAISKLIGIGSLSMVLLGIAGELGPMALGLGSLVFIVVTTIFGVLGLLLGSFERDGTAIGELLDYGIPSMIKIFEGLGDAFGVLYSKVFSQLGSGLGTALGKGKGNYLNEMFGGINSVITTVGDNVEKFSGVIAVIDDDVPTKLSSFASALDELATVGAYSTELEELGGSLDTLSTKVPSFASSMVSITDEQHAAVRETATTIKELGGAIEAIPPTHNLSSFFTGIHDVEKFGEDLAKLGRGMADYYVGLTTDSEGKSITFDNSLVSNSAIGAKALAELNDSIPETGGALQDLVGTQDLGSFAENLPALGSGLAGYQTAWGETKVNASLIKNSATAAQSIARLATLLPKSNGEFQNVFGTQDIGLFGTQLKDFGEGFMAFFTEIKDFEPDDATDQVAAVGRVYSDLENSLPPNGSVMHKLIFGEKGLDDFGKRLLQYGDYLLQFQAKLDAVSFPKLDEGSNFVDTLMTIFSRDINYENGFETIRVLNGFILSLGEALTDEVNRVALQDAGVLMLTTMLSGFDTEEARLAAGTNLDVILKLLSDSIVYNTTLETENFGGKLLIKVTQAITKALAVDASLKLAASAILKSIGKAIVSLKTDFNIVAKDIADGLANGMKSLRARASVFNAGIGLGRLAILGIRKGSDTHSPSKAAYEIGGFIGEGLDLGFTDASDAVYTSARSLGETAIAGLNEGVQEGVKKEDPFGYLQSVLGGDSRLLTLAMLSTMKTDKNNYDDFADAFYGLKHGNFVESYEKLAKLYGSNPLKMSKVLYDQIYSGWDEKNLGAKPYKNWRALYGGIMAGAISPDTILDSLMTKFGVDFESPEYLMDDFNSMFEETDNKVNDLIDDINVGLIKTLGDLERKYRGLHEAVDLDFNRVAEEVKQAQIDYLAMQNDPNASKEDLELAYRRLTILQGSLDSLDKQHELLDKQHEQEKRLAELEAENAKSEAQNTASRRSATDALGFSASDTGSKLDDLAESAEEASESIGGIDDAAAEAAEGLDDYKDNFARSGYDLATAFQEDGWWKSFIDGAEEGGTLFNTEGWDLGEMFKEGFQNALFGGENTGIMGIFNRLVNAAEEGTLSFKMILEEGVNGILEYFGLKAIGVEFDFDTLITSLKTKAAEFLNGLGIDFDNLAGSIINFLGSFGIDTTNMRASWQGFVSRFTDPNNGGFLGSLLSKVGLSSTAPTGNTSGLTSGGSYVDSSGTVVFDPDLVVINPGQVSKPAVQPIQTIGSFTGQLWNQLTSGFSNKNTAAAANSATASFKAFTKEVSTARSSSAGVVDNSGVVAAINSLEYRVKNLQSDVKNQNMVLDTGAVVGGISRGVRGSIANMTVLEGRGV